jgi:hypothetical protein
MFDFGYSYKLSGCFDYGSVLLRGDRVAPYISLVFDADYSAFDIPCGHYKFFGYFKVKCSDELGSLFVYDGGHSRNIYLVFDSDYSDCDTDFGHYKLPDCIVLGSFFACDLVIALVSIAFGNYRADGGNERDIFSGCDGYFVLDIYFVFDSDYSGIADCVLGDYDMFDFGYYKLFRCGSRVLPRPAPEAG